MIIKTEKQMRPREKDDHYPTPSPLCVAALRLVPQALYVHRILDPGCGSGVWGQAARMVFDSPLCITGIEVRDVPTPQGYEPLVRGDFLCFECDPDFDLVVGNPPYKYAEAFIRKGMDCLRDGGYMVYLLRLAFLEGQDRMAKLWREMPPHQVAVCGARPSFTGDGKTDATAYAVYVWRKGYPIHPISPRLMWLDWKGV